MKQLETAAQVEADEYPEVAQARYALIGASSAVRGTHPPDELESLKRDADDKLAAYTSAKDARTRSIIDGAMASVAGPARAGGCPVVSNWQQQPGRPPTKRPK